MNPNSFKILMNEITSAPLLKDFVGKNAVVDLTKVLNDDSINKLNYFLMCYHETLRIEPPYVFSTLYTVKED
jgi:hypothetical protein